MRWFVIFLFFLSSLRANTDTLFPDDEDLTLYHHVNVITGNLNLHFQDALVQGAQSLPLIRTYTSAGALEEDDQSNLNLKQLRGGWLIQGGWNLLPHATLFVLPSEEDRDFQIFLPEKNGATISYRFASTEKDYLILKPDIKGGQCSGVLSARTNPRNNILKIDPRRHRAILFLPDGGQRHYQCPPSYIPTSGIYYLCLKSEIAPNGHRTEYTYNNYGELKHVSVMNPNQTKTFSWLHFKVIKRGEGSHHFRFQATTSDEKFFDYRSCNLNRRNYLHDVQSNCRPNEIADFIPGREGIGARMQNLTFGNNLQFTVHYSEPKDHKHAKKWQEDPKKKPFSADKVQLLEAPIGPQGQMLPIARFSYLPKITDVRDIDNILTRYHHDQDRLLSIEYFDEHDQLSSILRFTWEGSQLKSKAMLNANSETLFAKTFQYDALGNVIEETLCGNLTGLSNAETYRKRFSYLPGFNVPILEEEEEGPTYRYAYKPGTNLLTAKFICDKDHILIRQFFFYNEDHLLIREIIDNGQSENPNDLNHVTERRYKHYELNGDGLPQTLRETYLDLETGQEKLIQKSEYTYSTRKLVINEAVYDANDTCRYHIQTGYDAQGRVILKTTPLGQKNTYAYDPWGNLLESKEVGAPQKIYTYNRVGQPLSCEEIYTDGTRKISYSQYDPKGRLLSHTDTKGNTTIQHYDAFGRCRQTQFPQVKNEHEEPYDPVISFTYDSQGNIASTTSPRLETIHTTYNTLKKPIRIIQPDGTQIQHIYNKNGTLARTIYPDDTTVEYTYDLFQRMLSKSTYSKNHELLSQETWEYNAFHLLSYIDPRGLITTYQYDGTGRLISECSENREKIYSYDALGFLERITDGNLTEVNIHDQGGRVIEQWTEDLSGKCENRMRFSYDGENLKTQAIRITSQGEAVDLFFYDGERRLTRHVDPLGHITQFIYTLVPNDLNQYVLQKTTIDPLGNTTIETYDALDHLISIEKKDPQGKTVAKESLHYDAGGNRSKRISTIYHGNQPIKTIETLWEHDCFGHITKEIESHQKITSYEYDNRGRIKTKILPNQTILSYSHDGIGRLTELFSSDGTIHYQYFYESGPEPTTIIDFIQNTTLQRTYNAFGQLTDEISPYGLAFHWDYDEYGRCNLLTLPDNSSIAYFYSGHHLTTVQRQSPQGKPLYEHHYTQFDPNGHVQNETLIHHLGTIQTTHDLLERPISQTSSWLQHSVTYGPSGLVITQQNSLFGEKQYLYDPLNQLLQEGHEKHAFDSLGNPIDCTLNDCNQILASKDCTLCYDDNGNPTTRTTSTETTSYSYDALGRLTEITLPNRKVHYFYDAFSRLLAKQTPDSTIYYLYDQDKEIGTISPSHEIQELKVLGLGIKGDIGAAIAIEIGKEVFAPLHDFNGHIIALLSSTGTIVEQYQLTAFGCESTNTSPINPWRFCSKRNEEGFIFFGKRFYDPFLGRWLTPDPAGFIEGPNLYLFVLNNPTNRLDLFGLRSQAIYPWSNEPDGLNIEIDIKRLQTANIKEFIECKGAIRDVVVDLVVCCDHWHKLQFTPEEQEIGKVNIVNHFHDIMPKEGTLIGIITAQNGINTPLNEFRSWCETAVNNIHESTLFIGLHNPTHGFISDLIRVCKEKVGIETQTVCLTRQFMTAVVDQLDRINPNLLWLGFTHSEAGLIQHRAIKGMDPDHKQLIEEHLLYRSFGGARPMPNRMVKEAVNIYSEKDYVTKWFAKPYQNDNDYDIRYVDCKSSRSEMNLYIADHGSMGSTYQQSQVDQIKDARDKFGFYNEQKR